jgi:hypothetical protein
MIGSFASASVSETTLANGEVVATWIGSNNSAHAAILNPDGSIAKSDFVIAVNNAAQPQVSALSGGGFVVTWTDSSGTLDSSGTGVVGELFNSAGTATSAPFLVNTATAGNQQNGGVAELANGGFVSTWLDLQTNQFDAQIFNSTGGKVGGVIAVGTAGASSTPPYVAALGDGDFVVAWEDPNGVQAHAQVFNPNGTPNGVEVTTDGVVSGVTPKGASDFVLSFSSTNPVIAATAKIFSATDDLDHSELAQNPTTGQLDFLSLTGANLTSSFLTSAGYWPVVAEGSLGGNGQPVDLVTQQNGQIDLLYMEGTQVVGSNLLGGTYWDVKGSGIFPQTAGVNFNNGAPTGNDPVLVTQNKATGQIDLLGFNPGGSQLQSSWLFNGSYDPVVGVGDFFGNGGTQIATQNSAGQIDILSFNGTNLATSSLIPGTYWPVKGTTDLNGDGFADLITQSPTTGQVEDLLLNGHQVIGTQLENAPSLAGLNLVNGSQAADQFWHV